MIIVECDRQPFHIVRWCALYPNGLFPNVAVVTPIWYSGGGVVENPTLVDLSGIATTTATSILPWLTEGEALEGAELSWEQKGVGRSRTLPSDKGSSSCAALASERVGFNENRCPRSSQRFRDPSLPFTVVAKEFKSPGPEWLAQYGGGASPTLELGWPSMVVITSRGCLYGSRSLGARTIDADKG